jgi:NAD(P)-dependent dehydrogenase (short-subunit alcohol dehydrogenase family)
LVLAVSVARLGVDVAVVCQNVDADQARYMKNHVEAENQQCLIVPVLEADDVSPVEAVRQTIEMLGRLDFFIDCSSPEEKPANSNEELHPTHGIAGSNQNSPLVHLEMLAAALDQMIDINVMI